MKCGYTYCDNKFEPINGKQYCCREHKQAQLKVRKRIAKLGKCKHCGNDIPYGRTKFCSDNCVDIHFRFYYRSLKPVIKKEIRKPWNEGLIRYCKSCGIDYKPKQRRQKYCKDGCGGYTKHANNNYYQSKEWKELRKQFFSISVNNWCVDCLDKGIYKTARVADHIKPRIEGGIDSISNLQGLCFSHHQSKSAQYINKIKFGNSL